MFQCSLTECILLALPSLSEGEEGGGEGALLVEIGFVVEVADSVLHACFEGAHGCLRATDGCAQILHEHSSNLVPIVTVSGKIVYKRGEAML